MGEARVLPRCEGDPAGRTRAGAGGIAGDSAGGRRRRRLGGQPGRARGSSPATTPSTDRPNGEGRAATGPASRRSWPRPAAGAGSCRCVSRTRAGRRARAWSPPGIRWAFGARRARDQPELGAGGRRAVDRPGGAGDRRGRRARGGGDARGDERRLARSESQSVGERERRWHAGRGGGRRGAAAVVFEPRGLGGHRRSRLGDVERGAPGGRCGRGRARRTPGAGRAAGAGCAAARVHADGRARRRLALPARRGRGREGGRLDGARLPAGGDEGRKGRRRRRRLGRGDRVRGVLCRPPRRRHGRHADGRTGTREPVRSVGGGGAAGRSPSARSGDVAGTAAVVAVFARR